VMNYYFQYYRPHLFCFILLLLFQKQMKINELTNIIEPKESDPPQSTKK
jgi:hypothetical protein